MSAMNNEEGVNDLPSPVGGMIGRLLGTGGGVLSGDNPLEDHISLFLVQAVIIIGLCRFLGLIGAYFKLPTVIFEITGGILLGPSALGRIPHFIPEIFPASSLSHLKLVADIGLLLYLFLVGMELDVPKLMTHAKKAGAVAICGMAVPFALGIAASPTIFQYLQADDPNPKIRKVSPTSFFVFIGTAMSITAFPVLARILKEGGLIYTKAGALVMGAAAVNDAVAWCLLILAIAIGNSQSDLSNAGYVFLSVFAMATGMLAVIAPLFEKLVAYLEAFNSRAIRQNLFALTLMICFICSWTTQLLGLDVIFGSFIFGLAIPRKSLLFKDCNEFIEELILVFMLPLYFALSGLRTDITQITTGNQGAMVVFVCFIATIGKVVGCGLPAYFTGGMTVREATTVAILMNTRGLVELIVLNLGLSAGILNTKTFSVMVIMCLFTTFITGPLLDLSYPPHIRTALDDGKVTETTSIQSEGSNEEVGEGSTEVVMDIEQLARNTRMTVVVDRVEHLQGLMDLISCLTPLESGSELSIAAVFFKEPSFTRSDEFLGLNDDNRLVEVKIESSEILDADAAYPTLLPLTMFTKAIGGSIRAYDVKGSPFEFPHELKTLSVQNKSNLILVPWRESDYFQELFWSSLKTGTAPMALLVIPTVAVPVVPEGRQRRVSFKVDSNPSGPAGPMDFPHYLATAVNEAEAAEVEESAKAPTGSKQHKSIQRVLAIITDKATDVAILPSVLRMAERESTKITVVVVGDHTTFAPHIRKLISIFLDRVKSCPNVTVDTLEDDYDSIDLAITLVKFIGDRHFDLLLHGFITPNLTHGLLGAAAAGATESEVDDDLENPSSRVRQASQNTGVHAPRAMSIRPSTRVDRSKSIAETMLATLTQEPSVVEKRMKFGMPELVAQTDLPYPELGELGHHLLLNGKATKFLVFHEPTSFSYLRNRSRTITQMDVDSTAHLQPLNVESSFAARSSDTIQVGTL